MGIKASLHLSDRQYSDFKRLSALNGAPFLRQGKIFPLSGIQNRLTAFYCKKEQKLQLKKRVTKLIEKFEAAPQGHLSCYETEVRRLFKKLSRLDSEIFNRKKIVSGGAIEKLLCPGLSDAQEKNAWQRAALQAKLSAKLGVDYELASTGHTGTYFVKSCSGKKEAVFKPFKQGIFEFGNPRMLSWMYRKFSYTGIQPGELHLGEEAASVLDRYLGLGIVPETNRIVLKHPRSKKRQLGSFRLFASGTEASRALHMSIIFRLFPRSVLRWILHAPLLQKRIEKKLPSDVEKLALLDLVMFNYDRNFGNWMIRKDGSKRSTVAIDNGGTSFPTRHPEFTFNLLRLYFDRRTRFFWEILPVANRPFSSKMRRLILQLNPAHMAETLRPHLIDPIRPSTAKSCEKKLKCLKERVVDLQKQVRKGKTIRQIALKSF